MRQFHALLLLLLLSLTTACNNFTSFHSGERCDSLHNELASMRYMGMELFGSVVDSVIQAEDDVDCMAFLMNSKAYVAMMEMDYKRAAAIYDSVISTASNELDRLEANVGMLRLCNRVSANKEFFDYRADAMRSIHRIDEEMASLSDIYVLRFNRLLIDYNAVSANYFAGLGLYKEYQEAVGKVTGLLSQVPDTASALMAGLATSSLRTKTLADRFASLFRGVTQSQTAGYKWLSAHYKLMTSMMLRDSVVVDSLYALSPGRFVRLCGDSVALDDLSCHLAEQALDEFADCGDRYMVIKGLALLASCHIYAGRYETSLDISDIAIDEVNRYYAEYYPALDTLPRYMLYQAEDSLEIMRMSIEGMINIPECMLLIRNEVSCAYAALGDKEASDMNRNSYLDLLRVIRQNREIESRAKSAADGAKRMLRMILVLCGVIVVALVLFVVLLKRWRRRNRRYTSNLMRLLSLCKELARFPLTREFVDSDDVNSHLSALLSQSLRSITGELQQLSLVAPDEPSAGEFVSDYPIDDSTVMRLVYSRKPSGDTNAFVKLVVPYVQAAKVESCKLVDMGDERMRIEELNLSYAMNLREHKRDNVMKRAALSVASGIRPYMNRMYNELRKISSVANDDAAALSKRLVYVAELTDKIGELNTILERWIKMRRGELSLNIENFTVQELFDIISKSAQAFMLKGIKLNVRPTTAVVKADKALTRVMINTWAENASKFTPEGGVVEVTADSADSYVEISVKDSGVGLSADDIRTIMDEKVYDASTIGADGGDAVRKNKGGGFGLMNCKGIIEKYKKTDSFFSVCSMNVESEKGVGSRFSFRLPRGVIRTLLVLLSFVPCALYAQRPLGHVTSLADSVYLSNVSGQFENTLYYAGRVLDELNSFYAANGGNGNKLVLSGSGEAAEVQWWHEGFGLDSLMDEVYYNILDVRNESAVAMLALQYWDDYRYNNNAYTALYRLVHEDKELEVFYLTARRQANICQVAVVLCFTVLLVIVLASLLYYFKNCVINRMNMYTALEVNRRMLKIINGTRFEVGELAALLANELFDSLSELLRISAVEVAISDAAGGKLQYASSSPSGYEHLKLYMQKAFEDEKMSVVANGRIVLFPLLVSASEGNKCVGVVAFEAVNAISFNERLMLEVVVGYVASAGYHAAVGMEREYRNFDELVEENRRIKYEENMLHVQNQVMDNSLSMIKHETIYYPSRIRDLVMRLMAEGGDDASRKERVAVMFELMEYYNSVYGVLITCAAEKPSDATFDVARLSIDEIVGESITFAKKRAKRVGISLNLQYRASGEMFHGDRDLVLFLMESLLAELVAAGGDGALQISARPENGQLCVEILDERRHLGSEELSLMFMPSSHNLVAGGDSLSGTGFLVAKEIVRMHEDFMGIYGGRMEAYDRNDGTVICFTLPK
ncbi:MAG: DUF5113 domain-containing protein [Bacteroidaceae bacterium]|nr:DUF5113 domain-containing protein [Bacteroidaceae bacterium]